MAYVWACLLVGAGIVDEITPTYTRKDTDEQTPHARTRSSKFVCIWRSLSIRSSRRFTPTLESITTRFSFICPSPPCPFPAPTRASSAFTSLAE